MSDFTVDVLIEIPKGSRNKYEYDKKNKFIRFDRMLFSSVQYPCDYGFIMDTLSLDGDPLDALVLIREPTFPGCVIEVKPVAIFIMSDDKGPDEKVLSVPVKDPIWNVLTDLAEVPPHMLIEIKHFFATYKELEGKEVIIEGWKNKEEAIRIIQEARERHKKQS